MGARSSRLRRRRNPAHLDGSRWHAIRLRLRTRANHRGRRLHSCNRLGRCRFSATLHRRLPGRSRRRRTGRFHLSFRNREYRTIETRATRRQSSHEVAMLIPSIDLMGGKIVQLVQGEKKALEFDDFEPWLERFAKYPLIQIIDLDAAIGQGDNRKLVRSLLRRLPCQVGGGIRTAESAQEMLGDGALRVIIGSSLIRNGSIQNKFAEQLAGQVGAEKLIFAVDSKGGKVAIRGW